MPCTLIRSNLKGKHLALIKCQWLLICLPFATCEAHKGGALVANPSKKTKHCPHHQKTHNSNKRITTLKRVKLKRVYKRHFNVWWGASGATLWSRTPIFHLPFLPLAVAFAFGSCFTAFGGGVWGHSAFSSSFCFFLCMDLMWLTNGLKSKPACLIDKLHQSHFGRQGPLSNWESCWARVAMLSAMAHLRRDSSRTCQGYTFIPTLFQNDAMWKIQIEVHV